MDTQKQIDYYRHKFDLEPQGRFFVPLADLLQRTGQPREAAELLENGLQHHPDHLSALVLLGRCQRDLGDEEAALRTWQQVLDLDGENLPVLRNLAEAALARQDWPAASDLWAKVVELDPHDAEAEDHLARLREEESRAGTPDPGVTVSGTGPTRPAGGAEQASAIAAEAEDVPVSRAGKSPTGENGGEATIDTDPEKTADSFLSAVTRNEAATGSLATKTLADIYLSQGYREKAVQILERILKDDPERGDIRGKLDELRNRTDPAGSGAAAAGSDDPVEPGPPPATAPATGPAGDPSPEAAGTDPEGEATRFRDWLAKIQGRDSD